MRRGSLLLVTLSFRAVLKHHRLSSQQIPFASRDSLNSTSTMLASKVATSCRPRSSGAVHWSRPQRSKRQSGGQRQHAVAICSLPSKVHFSAALSASPIAEEPPRASRGGVCTLAVAVKEPVVAAEAVKEPVVAAEDRVTRISTRGGTEGYEDAERALLQLLSADDLDAQLAGKDSAIQTHAALLNKAVDRAIAIAYPPAHASTSNGQGSPQVEAAHTFLQRLLYRINRLKYFWCGADPGLSLRGAGYEWQGLRAECSPRFTDLKQYDNEDSEFLAVVRRRVEAAWQPWETRQVEGYDRIRNMNVEEVKAELLRRGAADVDPEPSPAALYMRERMGKAGYACLLATTSLDGLTEAARQSRTLATVGHEVTMANFKVMMEEYGGGRLAKKHSTFFTAMMKQVGLDTMAEVYFDIVPWQLLADINHNFLLTNRRRTYLQYMGGLTYFEISGPSAYREYAAAARRLNLDEAAYQYWELHMREDGERHGPWMLNDVCARLADQYPEDAWEILLGYVQEQQLGARASGAILNAIKAADESGQF